MTAFLDRCDDVLTDWHPSRDAMRAVGYVVVDDPFEALLVRSPLTVPVVPDVQSVPRAFAEAMRGVVDAAQDTCRHVGVALRHVGEQLDGANRIGIVVDDPTPTDPRERALYLRRHRNTGPHLHRLDGRRR